MLASFLAPRLARLNIHYGWVIVAVTFLTMLSTAGAMGLPGALILPLNGEFGWDVGSISSALALRLALFGLMGPFSAGQDRIAPDRVREDRPALSRVLARSAIFRLLTRRTGLPRNEDEDRRTLIAIVAEADRLVKSQYGVPLTVLLWDVGPAYPLMHERGDQLKRELASKGIPVVALSERAPQLDELRFYFPNEGHPNGAAYAEAAQVLARWRRNR